MGPIVDSELRNRVDALSPAQRRSFRRRLGGLDRIAEPARRARALSAILGDLEKTEMHRRRIDQLAIRYSEDLPITAWRAELLAAIRDNQVVIVAGETGSGKSTQIPKLCLELGRGTAGLIGHTQPRRIAARSISERIAEELGSSVGDLIGYTVRFTDRVGEDTLVKVMTDGILLAEIQRDRLLRRYDTIIVDEAHERSLNVDFLLGYLKTLLPRRQDLKLIVTSATIDTERFSEHFDGAPVVEVSGRNHPVEIRYRPLDGSDGEVRDQPQAICDAILELPPRDDILVFCSGEREIRDAADAIGELDLRLTEVLPLYGRLSAAEQHRVFEGHTGRRIVLATNVAETSLTVPGIRAVIDPGTARISRYNRRTKVQRLPIEPISKASAEQRAGRCGRVGPGICIRLYSEDDFEGRDEYTEPEIQRTSLASVILQMAALGLGEIESFPFLDPPDTKAIRDGVALLVELGAVDPEREGSGRWLTPMGRTLARLPLDPRLARMVVEAGKNGCLGDVLVIVAALAIQDPRERPTGKEQQADQLHARFRVADSDFLGWLQLWSYLGDERRARTSSQFRRLCRDEFLNYRRVREWQDVHAQLRDAADELNLGSGGRGSDPDTIHRSILSGLLSHLGVKDPDSHEYRGAHGSRFSLSPASVLFKRSPEHLMAAELVETTRLWAHAAAGIRPEWVEDVGSHLLRRSYSDPWWDGERGSAVATETVTIYGLTLVPSRTIQYGRIDPAASRSLFIRHALVADEWDGHHAFLEHNRRKIAEVLAIEERERRSDLLVADENLYDFFDARIPAEITTTRHFDRWWRDAKEVDPHQLDLALEDVIDRTAPPPDTESFPPVWHHGDVAMPLDYRFDPRSDADGLTVEVPLQSLDRVDPTLFDWHVPGMREELITELIRTLPKSIRKHLVPVAETARQVIEGLDPAQGGLLPSLRREVSRVSGVEIPLTAFDPARLPPHLRPAFRVVDDEGVVLAEGSDLAVLKEELARESRLVVQKTQHPIERSGITSWDFGELPRSVEIEGPVSTILAYPALVDDGEAVSIRVVATEREQMDAHWDGVRRLLLLVLPSPGKLLRRLLTDPARDSLRSGPYEGVGEWADDCLRAATNGLLAAGLPFDGVAFDRLVARAKDELDEKVTSAGKASLEVFEALHRVELAAARLPERFSYAVSDVATQLNMLIFPGFISSLGSSRLMDVLRYLDAAHYRLEKLPENPVRDKERMERVLVLEERYEHLLGTLPMSDRLAAIGWQLQELRVSLFAQVLGTREAVSEKRVRRALQELAIHG